MDTSIQANSPKVEIPHWPTVQHRKEKVLGDIPIVNEVKKDERPSPLKLGDTVYFTAFSKEDSDILFVCKGEVTKIPDGDKVKAYRVHITAVADRAIGCKPSVEQKNLIGRAMNKRIRELHKHMGPIMMPKNWLS